MNLPTALRLVEQLLNKHFPADSAPPVLLCVRFPTAYAALRFLNAFDCRLAGLPDLHFTPTTEVPTWFRELQGAVTSLLNALAATTDADLSGLLGARWCVSVPQIHQVEVNRFDEDQQHEQHLTFDLQFALAPASAFPCVCQVSSHVPNGEPRFEKCRIEIDGEYDEFDEDIVTAIKAVWDAKPESISTKQILAKFPHLTPRLDRLIGRTVRIKWPEWLRDRISSKKGKSYQWVDKPTPESQP